MKYVIIGNGTAAVGCIEAIRSIDKSGKITIVSEETHHVYGRPLISYYLEGKTNLEQMKYRPDSFYSDNNCTVLYGKRASSLNGKMKKITFDDGQNIEYDKLCIATGSRPFVPPFEGLEKVNNKFSFMTLDDALALEKTINKDSRILIVGAGLIGLKCAEGIFERVKSITVCDLADRVLSSILDSDCAAVVQKNLEEKGIKFLLGDTAIRFDSTKAYMKSGKIEEFDVLILAVGVRANTELVKDAGGKVGRGIVVNTKMETNITDVFAAGDCAEGYDLSIGENRVLAILPNAYIQGKTAGINMAGGNETFENAIPMNSIGFFGVHMMTAGAYDGEMIEEKSDEAIKRFFIKDGLLNGFILIGETQRAGIYTSLIREKIPLDEIDLELTKKAASNLMFPKKIRRKKFGGVV